MTNKKQPTKGLAFNRRFTKEDVSVFDQFQYDYRTSVIRNPSGEIVFEMNNVEVPKQWSQIATDILAQKYFRKAGVPQPDGSTWPRNLGKTGCPSYGQLLESLGRTLWLFCHPKKMPPFFMKSWCISILNQACVPNQSAMV